MPEESMINRRRERKGLPSSFSSNLSRPRVSPPRTTGEGGAAQRSAGGNSSVKAIVAWLESSSSQQTTFVSPGDGESTKSKLSSVRTPSPVLATAAPVAQTTIQTSPDVEEYSLTLLEYRQYFTASPLGRCLDEQLVNFRRDPGSRQDEPAHGCQYQSPMIKAKGEDAKNPETSNSATDDQEHSEFPICEESSATKLFKRDSRDVAAFWNQIRSYLWITDEELEAQKETKKSKRIYGAGFFKIPIQSSLAQDGSITHAHAHDPEARSHQFSKSCSKADDTHAGRKGYQIRKRPKTTGDTVSEIDAFLAEDGPMLPADSVLPTTPVITATIDCVASAETRSKIRETRRKQKDGCQVSRGFRCDKTVPMMESSRSSSSRSRSSHRLPPPRSKSIVSSNKPRVPEPPIRDGLDEERNFF